MKGTIFRCLQDVVTDTAGADVWINILKKSQVHASSIFAATDDFDNELFSKLITVTSDVLQLDQQIVFDKFGEHWSKKYAPKLYSVYFRRANSLRDFLLSMDHVHDTVTRRIENAQPPRFTYDDSTPDILIMSYNSSKGLAKLMPGLVKGAAQYYNEKVDVSLVGNQVTIKFLSIESIRR